MFWNKFDCFGDLRVRIISDSWKFEQYKVSAIITSNVKLKFFYRDESHASTLYVLITWLIWYMSFKNHFILFERSILWVGFCSLTSKTKCNKLHYLSLKSLIAIIIYEFVSDMPLNLSKHAGWISGSQKLVPYHRIKNLLDHCPCNDNAIY